MSRRQKGIHLFDFADAINTKVVITRMPNRQPTVFYCEFKSCNIRVFDGHVLEKKIGAGSSPAEAMKDYVNNIRGERLVLNYDIPENRQEFTAPENLTA